MPSINKPIASLSEYFKSKEFRARLDEIRSQNHDKDSLKVLAFSIAQTLDLKNDHANVIYQYLRDGKYNKKTKRSELRVTDAAEIRKQSRGLDLDENSVFIEVGDDINKDDLIALIADSANWRRIRNKLDENYPDRIVRFAQTYSINTYLEITRRVLQASGPETRTQLMAALAVDYKKEIPDIRAIVKKYTPFFEI